MSSKCTAAKAYDILGIYDFPDDFDALNGLHSYLYANSDMVVEALASQKYDLARDIVTAIETVNKDGSYDDCAFYVSRDGIRILRTAEELIDALGDENGKTASTLLAKNGINVYAEGFQEIGSLFGREGTGVGFAKQTDGESFTYAFAWPEGDAWATLTGYLNLDEQPEEYVRRVLQDGGFRSDWDNPDYDPIGDFKETAGDEYRIPLLKVLLREQLESRYEVANHFPTMNRARVELSAFIQNEGGAPLPEDALGTPEKQGIRAIFATEEMAKAGYLSQLDYSKVVEMGDFYTVLNGDIVAVGFDPETGESRSFTDGELSRVEGYFTVISKPGSGEKAVDAIRHGMEPCGYDISVETHDMASGKDALLADAPQRDAPAKDTQNIG